MTGKMANTYRLLDFYYGQNCPKTIIEAAVTLFFKDANVRELLDAILAYKEEYDRPVYELRAEEVARVHAVTRKVVIAWQELAEKEKGFDFDQYLTCCRRLPDTIASDSMVLVAWERTLRLIVEYNVKKAYHKSRIAPVVTEGWLPPPSMRDPEDVLEPLDDDELFWRFVRDDAAFAEYAKRFDAAFKAHEAAFKEELEQRIVELNGTHTERVKIGKVIMRERVKGLS